MVIEQFKLRLPFFILKHVEEQREESLTDAATLDDAHSLLEQSLNTREKGGMFNVISSPDGQWLKKSRRQETIAENRPPELELFCPYCKLIGHTI